MTGFSVVSNEVEIRITHVNSGEELLFDKILDIVSLNGATDYSNFIKMTKLLKRAKTKEAFDNTCYVD